MAIIQRVEKSGGRRWKPKLARFWRHKAFLALDALLAAASLLVAVHLRIGAVLSAEVAQALVVGAPLFAVIAAVTFSRMGLYDNIWRYASVPDLVAIIRAVTIAIVAFILIMFLMTRLEAIPRSTPLIQWFVLVMLMGGARMAHRADRGALAALWPAPGSRHKLPVLLVGAGDGADLFLQALARDPAAQHAAVGILDLSGQHRGRSLRSVPVLGTCEELERVVQELDQRGRRPQHLIVTEPANKLGGARMQQLVRDGEALGLVVSRLPEPTEFRRARGGEIELRPIELVDLLGRPQARLDRASLGRLIAGRRVLVTGAGGTIGGELACQIAALDPAELILIDSGEFNLYQIDVILNERRSAVPRWLHLCNVRDRDRLMRIFARHRPELVFHAAALKHVPMVELNPCEGVLTNVVGTRNVADACCRYEALAMVQVSSDKVVNPTSVMGATKRLAELYCQALDLHGSGDARSPRFMTVRFGNVLGSSGSLIPLFERQLKRGGPLTVTHPEMRRYFMTVREAVELVLQASAHGLEHDAGVGEIFVLDMGEPVKILDIAQRMIRLAGLRPEIDVKVEIVGLRPGEKLYEELFDEHEARLPGRIPGILGARPNPIPLDRLQQAFERLGKAAAADEVESTRRLIAAVLPSYRTAAAAA